MAEYATLARPYGNAVFAFAKSAGALSRWSRLLGMLSAALAEPRVRVLVESPELPAAHKAERLAALCGDLVDAAGQRFLQALASNGRLPLLAEVRRHFEELKAQEEQVLEVEVRSALPLTDAQAEELKAALKARFNKEVQLSSEVETGLIGGAVIRAGDKVIDGSMRGRLDGLGEALAQV